MNESSDPSLEWERLLPNYNELYDFERWRAYKHYISWKDDATFEMLREKLEAERSVAGSFYERFGYEWTLNRECYEYPAEILHQHLALTALTGIWNCVSDELRDNGLFGNICTRLIDRRGLKQSAPCLLAGTDSWKFVRFTSVWFDFLQLSIDSFLSCTNGALNIERCTRDQHQLQSSSVEPYWDAMLISGIAGWVNCNEFMKPALIDAVEKSCGIEGVRHASVALNQPRDLLSEFALRFTLAHETSHYLDSAFGESEAVSDSEVIADYFALHGLRRYNWAELGGAYAPLLDEAKHVPSLSSQVFFYVLSMWVSTQNTVGLAFGESNMKRRMRSKALQMRVARWSAALGHEDFSDSNDVRLFYVTLMDHAICFEDYAKGRVVSLAKDAQKIDEGMCKATAWLKDWDAFDQWVADQLPSDAPTTMRESKERLAAEKA